MQSSFPHPPKLLLGGNFTPSWRRPRSRISNTKTSLQQELGKSLVYQTLASHREHFLGDHVALRRGFGAGHLGCPQPGFPLKDCWHQPGVSFWTHTQRRPSSSAALQKYHFHLSITSFTLTPIIWVFLKRKIFKFHPLP